jgi:hypothetical protein
MLKRQNPSSLFKAATTYSQAVGVVILLTNSARLIGRL